MAMAEWMQRCYELMGRPTFLEDSDDLPPKLLRLGGWLTRGGSRDRGLVSSHAPSEQKSDRITWLTTPSQVSCERHIIISPYKLR